MGAVYFYHLTRHPLEVTLPQLLGKARGAGWRVLVRGVEDARLDWLDEKLWLGPDESFLPHGRAGGPHDARQPILLSRETGQSANSAQCLMAVDGAEVSAEEVDALERTCVLFDGNDESALDHARGQWKTLTEAGCAAQYWSEASGRWEKKAEV
ncbi:DNA polymerase III subunit chi [Roseovarius rhodophyticola]|uniref:DNA polymerase III subunit chi n=1 Tax=Roseovarius rhodophyticola TaxID=3080827 RepID=A0ABZ2TET5_9RHOB|nr:DNA polymerase III subunit chi [Roseovarius sp. W115]MDV2928487.1 DNA polymerase III subunit chi [Roseovarius sp. W115]